HRSEGRGECGELLAFALGASRGGCARRKADGRGGHTAAVARPLARLEAADALVRLLERLAYGTAEPGAEAARLHALEQLLGPPDDLFALTLRRKDRELVAADPEDALVGAQYLSRGLAHRGARGGSVPRPRPGTARGPAGRPVRPDPSARGPRARARRAGGRARRCPARRARTGARQLPPSRSRRCRRPCRDGR